MRNFPEKSDTLVGVRPRDGLIVWAYVDQAVPGRVHDSRLARQYSNILEAMGEDEWLICDKGYQGMARTFSPVKNHQSRPLRPEERLYNNAITDIRIINENAIKRIKTFQCLEVRWRHHLDYHPFAFNLCANLANLTIVQFPLTKNNKYVDI